VCPAELDALRQEASHDVNRPHALGLKGDPDRDAELAFAREYVTSKLAPFREGALELARDAGLDRPGERALRVHAVVRGVEVATAYGPGVTPLTIGREVGGRRLPVGIISECRESLIDQTLANRFDDDERAGSQDVAVSEVPESLVDVDVQPRRWCSGDSTSFPLPWFCRTSFSKLRRSSNWVT
jgi:hypothetical protein